MQVPDGYKGVYHEVGSFTPYTLNSSYWVILTGLITEQSQLQRTKMYISGLIPTGPSVLESSHTCHLRYDLVFQEACSRGATIPFQSLLSWGYNLRNHTEWPPTPFPLDLVTCFEWREKSKSDGVQLWRLDLKRHVASSFVHSDHLLWGKPAVTS